MSHIVSDIAFTAAVKAAQRQRGSRDSYARMEQRGGWQNLVTPELTAFLAQRDSFYLGTASKDVERAKLFYQSVFDWRFEEWGPPDFCLIHTGSERSPRILGAHQKRTQTLGTGCNRYECSISVESIEKTEAKITVSGGTILVKPVEIPTVGVLVKFSDTEGNEACAIQYFAKS